MDFRGLTPPLPGTLHQLPAAPDSARLARLLVSQALQEASADTAYVAAVLVSELVANAVLHGQAPIELEIESAVDRICVSVRDCSPRAPLPSLQQADDTISGRGLQIVDALASAWGWEPTDVGKRVWFELRPGLQLSPEPASSGTAWLRTRMSAGRQALNVDHSAND